MKLLFSLTVLLIFTMQIKAQEEFTKKDAQKLVETFFEGFHKGDTLLMKSVMAEEVVFQTASTNREGKHSVSETSVKDLLKAIGTRPADQKWDEQIESYTLQIDGNLAHVWTPYKFYFNGNFSHCGANAFTFARFDEGWKLVHLIDSRRRSTCED